jgi:hypothetical protein
MTAPVDATDAVSVLSEMVAEARPDRTLATAFVGALRALWLEDMRSQQQPAAVLTSEVANGRESPEVEAAVAGDLSAEATRAAAERMSRWQSVTPDEEHAVGAAYLDLLLESETKTRVHLEFARGRVVKMDELRREVEGLKWQKDEAQQMLADARVALDVKDHEIRALMAALHAAGVDVQHGGPF